MIEQEDARPAVGRLAPSPTGGLHVGHARTFLLAWLTARSAAGRVVLRIEDLDAGRTRLEAIDGAAADLRGLGLDWDEGPDVGGPHAPYRQSQRMAMYHDALERLRRAERVYPCTCTRADLARAASAPHAEDEGPRYPGLCAGRSAAEATALSAAGRAFAWRFRAPAGPIEWRDQFLGCIARDPAVLGGDFLVARSNGAIAYQLAVVVDDAAMKITQVVRGADLVPSTPRQIALYRALGLNEPSFGHVGLVVGPDGRRLAKRDGSIRLAALRERGVAPGRLLEALGRSLGIEPTPRAVRSPYDLIDRFDPARVPCAEWAWNGEGG